MQRPPEIRITCDKKFKARWDKFVKKQGKRKGSLIGRYALEQVMNIE